MQRSALTTAGHGTGHVLPPGILLPPLSAGPYDLMRRDIAAVLDSSAPDGAKLAAIAAHIAETGPVRQYPVPPGSGADDVAAIIAAQLALGDRPATDVFAGLLSREVTLAPIGPGFMRPAAADEAAALRLRPGEEIYVREGMLAAGSVQCARVTLKLAHQRVCQLTSGSTWGKIRTGTPAGTALGPHGLRPGHRVIEVIPDGDPRVRTWRVSVIRTVPVCVATEEVGEYLCRRLALGAG